MQRSAAPVPVVLFQESGPASEPSQSIVRQEMCQVLGMSSASSTVSSTAAAAEVDDDE